MPRLIPLEGPNAGRAVEVADGARVGRAPECEVRLAHASVSRVHARVERRGSAWFLVDAGSRNGLRTKEGRVAEIELGAPVEVWLGEVPLRAEPSEGRPSAPARRPAVAAAPPPAPATAADADFEFEDEVVVEQAALAARGEGLELEDPADIELDATTLAPRPPAPPPSPALAAREKQLAFLRAESRSRGGVLRGEFEQLAGWLQGLLFAVALALAAGLAFLGYRLVAG